MKKIIFFTLDKLGANAYYRNKHKDEIIVLMYHGVTPDDAKYAYSDHLQVKESRFREQMEYLKRYYDVVHLSDINNFNETVSDKPKAIITFDDGYANNYHVAYPILKALDLPATIFLVTNTINNDHVFWYDKLQVVFSELNYDQNDIDRIVNSFKQFHPHDVDEMVEAFLREKELIVADGANEEYRTLRLSEIYDMARSPLIEFGSHTHRHELLTMMSNDEVYDSLEESLQILTGLPNTVKYFCYPNGFFRPEDHSPICESLGLFGAVKADGGFWNENFKKFEIPRIGIGSDLTLLKFVSRISGLNTALVDIKNRLPI